MMEIAAQNAQSVRDKKESPLPLSVALIGPNWEAVRFGSHRQWQDMAYFAAFTDAVRYAADLRERYDDRYEIVVLEGGKQTSVRRGRKEREPEKEPAPAPVISCPSCLSCNGPEEILPGSGRYACKSCNRRFVVDAGITIKPMPIEIGMLILTTIGAIAMFVVTAF